VASSEVVARWIHAFAIEDQLELGDGEFAGHLPSVPGRSPVI
jgi:hypothetical protein